MFDKYDLFGMIGLFCVKPSAFQGELCFGPNQDQ